jgi:hypothetical protein
VPLVTAAVPIIVAWKKSLLKEIYMTPIFPENISNFKEHNSKFYFWVVAITVYVLYIVLIHIGM